MSESTDTAKIEAAQKALAHILKQMNTNPALRHEIGFGTQSYELLTEAAATLFDEPIGIVRAHYKG